MSERHELSFDGYDARVQVTDEGGVWVSFHESGKCVFSISAQDLGDVVAFVESHGQIKVTQP